MCKQWEAQSKMRATDIRSSKYCWGQAMNNPGIILRTTISPWYMLSNTSPTPAFALVMPKSVEVPLEEFCPCSRYSPTEIVSGNPRRTPCNVLGEDSRDSTDAGWGVSSLLEGVFVSSWRDSATLLVLNEVCICSRSSIDIELRLLAVSTSEYENPSRASSWRFCWLDPCSSRYSSSAWSGRQLQTFFDPFHTSGPACQLMYPSHPTDDARDFRSGRAGGTSVNIGRWQQRVWPQVKQDTCLVSSETSTSTSDSLSVSLSLASATFAASSCKLSQQQTGTGDSVERVDHAMK